MSPLSRRRVHSSSDGTAGYSLLESMVSLMLSAVLLSSTLHVLLSSVSAQAAVTRMAEQTVMLCDIDRVVRQDIHAATQVGVLWGDLTVTTLTGNSYRYVVNSVGQFVRVRTGGGTAVIASGVKSVTVTLDETSQGGGLVTLDIECLDGDREQVSIQTLGALEG